MEKILTENMNFMITATISVAIAFGILVLARFAIHKMFNGSYKSLEEVETKGNIAVAIRNAGIYIGVAMAMVGVISSPLTQLVDGLTALVFLLIATVVTDKIVFSKVVNSTEIGNGNISLAVAESGLFIGTGNIAMASFAGEGPYISSIVFFLLGQAVLVLAALTAEKVYKGIKDFIAEGNISAGILLGSVILGISFILRSAIYGDFNGWTHDIEAFLLYALFGFVLMFLFANKLIDLIFLPNSVIREQIEKDNVSAIVVVSGMKLAIALIISGVIL